MEDKKRIDLNNWVHDSTNIQLTKTIKKKRKKDSPKKYAYLIKVKRLEVYSDKQYSKKQIAKRYGVKEGDVKIRDNITGEII